MCLPAPRRFCPSGRFEDTRDKERAPGNEGRPMLGNFRLVELNRGPLNGRRWKNRATSKVHKGWAFPNVRYSRQFKSRCKEFFTGLEEVPL